MKQASEKQILCPSAKCDESALLLGIVTGNGIVSFFEDKKTIDHEFVETANKGRSPESRFRFADKCVKNGCTQWKNGKCGVIDQVLDFAKDVAIEETLPLCSIRPQCRWFNQEGKNACKICPYVITDLT